MDTPADTDKESRHGAILTEAQIEGIAEDLLERGVETPDEERLLASLWHQSRRARSVSVAVASALDNGAALRLIADDPNWCDADVAMLYHYIADVLPATSLIEWFDCTPEQMGYTGVAFRSSVLDLLTRIATPGVNASRHRRARAIEALSLRDRMAASPDILDASVLSALAKSLDPRTSTWARVEAFRPA